MKQIDCEQLVQDNRQICLRMERLANRFMEAEGLTAVQGHLLLYILLKGDSGGVSDLDQKPATQSVFGFARRKPASAGK